MPRAELFRDTLGVPHLRADDELALAEAQGRVTALDRTWQIEVDRWRAQGRLAERLGPAGLEWDRFARRIRLADTAERVFAALDADDRAWVEAYVRGVNAGLDAGRRRSPEFASLDTLPGERPADEDWEPWAPIGIFLVAHVLFSPFPSLLWRAHVARALGDDAVDWFTPGSAPSGAGSNAWAVHGSRTSSGAPLLGGDPHRLLELPGVYQQVRLACPEYDVVGLAFPGVPGVPHFGHTGAAAWGITNAIAHSVDVFTERLDDDVDGLRALGPDGWEPTAHHVETIQVRGGESVPVRVIETARGTVVAGADAGEDPAAGAWSIRLPARIESAAGFAAFPKLLRARTAADVADAFALWSDPVNRVVAADRDGRVLRFTAGRVPERPVGERRLPLDGATVATVPIVSAMTPPEPVSGFAVDANERPAGRPHAALGFAYSHDARARRIAALLDAGPTDGAETPSALSRLHADTVSLRALALIARLRPHLAAVGTDAGRDLAGRLLDWDGDVAADSADAARYERWRDELVARVADDERLRPLHSPHGMGAIFDPWFSVRGRVGDSIEALLDAPGLGLDVGALLVAAIESVASGSAEGDGAAWGEAHRLHPLHVLADLTDPPDGVVVPGVDGVPLAGDGDTVRCTGSVPGVTPLGFRGSVARWTWDLGDRRRSRWNVPFGASGVPGDPHFDDQLTDWAHAATTEIVTDWDALDPEEWR
ncbi:hypothetical protein GB864_14055 [Agromyces sp. MMS17-SY077]|uniref:Penicillin acylase family protein n=2 Tax=Agromyces seonyuensis TaxID=2662446 RepID=A0A6I4NZW8_9MICO|nr:hypothetical protein [Agromyces seonyuensis]